MINHDEFVIEHKKPKELNFIQFYISDPERDKKYNSVTKIVEAMRKKLFVGGVYFVHDVFKMLKNGTFDRIKYEEINNSRICTYLKDNEERKVTLPEKVNINHFTAIMRDAGYDIRVEFKDKPYKKKKNKHFHDILIIKEKFQSKIYQEFNIKNIKVANEVFNKCWEENEHNTMRTQIAFMKQIMFFKKIGEEL